MDEKSVWIFEDENINIDDLITRLWAQQKDEECPGLNPIHIIHAREARDSGTVNPLLESFLLLYDQFLSWSASLALALNSALMNSPTTPASPLTRSSTLLSGAICSHLFAIRHLIQLGFDLQAKQVLRSMCEHVDVLNAILMDNSLATKFVATEDAEPSNQFWNNHVRRGKIRRWLYSRIPENTEEVQEALNSWKTYRNEEDSILSMAAHPTFIGCYVATVGSDDSEDDYWPGMFGKRGNSSARTLEYTMFSISELVMISDFPFSTPDVTIPHGGSSKPPLVDYDENNRFHRHVVQGRSVLTSILVFLLEHGKTHPQLARKNDLPFSDQEGGN